MPYVASSRRSAMPTPCLPASFQTAASKPVDGHLRAELDPDQIVPVLILDLDEDESEKLLTVLDPLAAMAEANTEALGRLLQEIETQSPAVQAMLDNLAAEYRIDLEVEGLTDPDEIPEPPDEAITQPGDLWILEDHRLLCGDGSKPEDVDRLLAGAKIQLVNTDPPYNVAVAPRTNNAWASGSAGCRGPNWPRPSAAGTCARRPRAAGRRPTTRCGPRTGRWKTTSFPTRSSTAFLKAWFGNIARVLEPGRCFYIWGGYANCGNYPPVLKAQKLYFAQAIIWVKEHPVLTRKDFMGNHEWCFYGWKEARPQVLRSEQRHRRLERQEGQPEQMVHLTEKPVELAVRAMSIRRAPARTCWTCSAEAAAR